MNNNIYGTEHAVDKVATVKYLPFVTNFHTAETFFGATRAKPKYDGASFRKMFDIPAQSGSIQVRSHSRRRKLLKNSRQEDDADDLTPPRGQPVTFCASLYGDNNKNVHIYTACV